MLRTVVSFKYKRHLYEDWSLFADIILLNNNDDRRTLNGIIIFAEMH